MKKIGILSVQNHNYGSILQAYALQTFLEGMGYQTEIIRYQKTNIIKQASRLLYRPLLIATVKAKWKNIYCKLFQRELQSTVLQSREHAFCKFVDEYLSFSEVFKGRRDLIEGCVQYDCFVLGSDQVWNPMNIGSDFFTMTFVPENKKKIAYAPSFGVSRIPKSQKKATAAYLQRIDYISVRERDGVKIVRELTSRDVPQVVDPTILLNKTVWDEKKGERIVIKDYIFCYFISANKTYRNFAKRLSKRTGLSIVSIPHVDEYVKADVGFGDILLCDIGPLEFINLISHASYVCTDSFHGSVFATLYERPFFTFDRYSRDVVDSTNSRLYSFLKLSGMEKRMYKPDAEIGEEELMAPDFSDANKRIAASRETSIKYLRDALQG
jgi:hypothetical protein